MAYAKVSPARSGRNSMSGRPEDPILPDHDQRVYDEAVKNFKLWRANGWLVQDPKPCYYVYAQFRGSTGTEKRRLVTGTRAFG